MKAKKFLGVFLTCAGCVAAVVGVAAAVLPLIPNDQLRLVLASFEAPSQNPVVSLMNGAMRYALHNCYVVLLAGLLAALAGVFVLLRLSAASAQKKPAFKPIIGKPAAAPQVPAWRSSKAAEVVAQNPFASPAVGDSLPAQTFAPRVAAKAPAAPYQRPPEAAAYQRPASSPYERPASPYERPAPAPEPPPPPPAYVEKPLLPLEAPALPPEPKPEPKPASPAPKKEKVRIVSTMGKHSV